MPTFVYRYAAGDPPAPGVLLNLAHPVTGRRTEGVPALVDTGADLSVLPDRLVTDLGLLRVDEQVVEGFDGGPRVLSVYLVILQVRDLPPVEVRVVRGDVTNAILGRDVLNRYKVTLDGPGQVMTISDDQ